MVGPFLKGLALSELFYTEAVRPLVERCFPGLPYSAGLLGPGSDVLGFDTLQSMDHDWGPRLLLFLSEGEYALHGKELDDALRSELPRQVHGYPTNFSRHPDGTRVMQVIEDGPVDHWVSVYTVRSFFEPLGVDPEFELRAVDWLTIPEQVLCSLTAGRVFHDGLGQLEAVRARLSYYPQDVWLYLLANQWQRISQEEPFPGRCGQVGDDLGACLVAARLVRDLMKLCFLMEKQYAPYLKWFGSAFRQLACAKALAPVLEGVLRATTWQMREKHLALAYSQAARMHNHLRITAPLSTRASHFHSRPFRVIQAGDFTRAIHAVITNPEVRVLPANLGGVDQFIDSTVVLSEPNWYGAFRSLYLDD